MQFEEDFVLFLKVAEEEVEKGGDAKEVDKEKKKRKEEKEKEKEKETEKEKEKKEEKEGEWAAIAYSADNRSFANIEVVKVPPPPPSSSPLSLSPPHCPHSMSSLAPYSPPPLAY